MAIDEAALTSKGWSDEQFASNLTEVVHLLMAVDGLRSAEPLGPVLEISTATIYRKMAKGSLTANEIRRLAEHFDIEPSVFYEPVELLRARLRRSGCFVPDTPTDLHGLPVAPGQISWDDDQLWPLATPGSRPVALRQIA